MDALELWLRADPAVLAAALAGLSSGAARLAWLAWRRRSAARRRDRLEDLSWDFDERRPHGPAPPDPRDDPRWWYWRPLG